MKKIVFLVQKLINAGPENVVLDICKCLDKTLYCPAVISLMDEDKERGIEDDFKRLKVEIVHIGAKFYQEELQTSSVAKKVREAYVRLNGDLLHVHCYHPSLISSYLRDIPIINTIHNISGEDFLIKKGWLMGNYMKWRFDKSLKKSDCIVAISDYMMEYYKTMCRKIVKIPNGVSFQRVTNFDINAFRVKYTLLPSQRIVVVTGTVSQRKNTTYTVSELKRSSCDFVCFIIGSGCKLEDCRQITKNDPRFKYEGFKSNVAEYLNAADLFISSSLSEGLPLSVLEAICMGVPCILSNIRPHEEIVNTMNCEGVDCFELEDGALLSKFDNVINKNVDTDNISKIAMKFYSSQVMARNYERIYEELISERL